VLFVLFYEHQLISQYQLQMMSIWGLTLEQQHKQHNSTFMAISPRFEGCATDAV
jgi:spore germination protein YaaH